MFLGNKLYQRFFQAFCKCHPLNSQATNQAKANELWKTIKKKNEHGLVEIDMEVFNSVVNNLEQKAVEQNMKKDIRNFFNTPTKTKKINPTEYDPAKELSILVDDEAIVDAATEVDLEDEEVMVKRSKPAQEKLETEVQQLEMKIVRMKEAKALSDTHESMVVMTKQIKALEHQKNNLDKKLKKKKQDAKGQEKARIKKKENFEKLQNEHPELAAILKSRETVGRPRIESDQPDLLKDVLEIATIGAACSDKRREDLFRTVKTLDDLQKAISDLGYSLSRTALYYRLLPRSSTSVAGRRHVKTVPVRLIR